MGATTSQAVHETHFVVEFLKCTDIPEVDIMSPSDPYVKAAIYGPDSNGKLVLRSKWVKTLAKCDATVGIYNTFRDLHYTPSSSDVLRVEVWDVDTLSKNDLIGRIDIPVNRLVEEVQEWPLKPVNPALASKHPNFAITLRRVFVAEKPPTRKGFFIVRHGESKWNEAQRNTHLSKMMAFDHGLTEAGIEQARQLNAKWKQVLPECVAVKTTVAATDVGATANVVAAAEVTVIQDDNIEVTTTTTTTTTDTAPPSITIDASDLEDIPAGPDSPQTDSEGEGSDINPEQEEGDRDGTHTEVASGDDSEDTLYNSKLGEVDKIFCSPLTRAVQTALTVMQNHKNLVEHGLELKGSIRECKNIGGLDTVGVSVGDEIMKRVTSEFTNTAVDELECNALTNVDVDIGDAISPWWTPPNTYDSKKDIKKRLVDMLDIVRYGPFKMPMFVGHSLFFKALYSTRIGSELIKSKPQLAENLKKYKLNNSVMMYVEVDFSTPKPVIVDAHLMFGGTFHP